jgi:transcription elongation factor GreA
VDNDLLYVGKECYEKMHEQLLMLTKVRRKEISIQIADARAQGDLSENAEYDAAKEAQAFNEMRIAELQMQLSRSRIIDEASIPLNKAVLGTTVYLKDMDDGEEISYALVSEPEADFALDKISISSPVGKGLLGHKEQDTVEIKVPSGYLRYSITKIERSRCI